MFDKIATFQILPDGAGYKGAFGEITIDLKLPGLRIHDGCTCGGMMTIVGEIAECLTAAALAVTEEKAAKEQAAKKTLNVTKVE